MHSSTENTPQIHHQPNSRFSQTAFMSPAAAAKDWIPFSPVYNDPMDSLSDLEVVRPPSSGSSVGRTNFSLSLIAGHQSAMPSGPASLVDLKPPDIGSTPFSNMDDLHSTNVLGSPFSDATVPLFSPMDFTHSDLLYCPFLETNHATADFFQDFHGLNPLAQPLYAPAYPQHSSSDHLPSGPFGNHSSDPSKVFTSKEETSAESVDPFSQQRQLGQLGGNEQSGGQHPKLSYSSVAGDPHQDQDMDQDPNFSRELTEDLESVKLEHDAFDSCAHMDTDVVKDFYSKSNGHQAFHHGIGMDLDRHRVDDDSDTGEEDCHEYEEEASLGSWNGDFSSLEAFNGNGINSWQHRRGSHHSSETVQSMYHVFGTSFPSSFPSSKSHSKSDASSARNTKTGTTQSINVKNKGIRFTVVESISGISANKSTTESKGKSCSIVPSSLVPSASSSTSVSRGRSSSIGSTVNKVDSSVASQKKSSKSFHNKKSSQLNSGGTSDSSGSALSTNESAAVVPGNVQGKCPASSSLKLVVRKNSLAGVSQTYPGLSSSDSETVVKLDRENSGEQVSEESELDDLTSNSIAIDLDGAASRLDMQTCIDENTLMDDDGQTIFELLTSRGLYWCRVCGVTEDTNWRRGPWGKNTLCNRHGVQLKRRLNLARYDNEPLARRKRPVMQEWCASCDTPSVASNVLFECAGCCNAYHQACLPNTAIRKEGKPFFCTSSCPINRQRLFIPRTIRVPPADLSVPNKETESKRQQQAAQLQRISAVSCPDPLNSSLDSTLKSSATSKRGRRSGSMSLLEKGSIASDTEPSRIAMTSPLSSRPTKRVRTPPSGSSSGKRDGLLISSSEDDSDLSKSASLMQCESISDDGERPSVKLAGKPFSIPRSTPSSIPSSASTVDPSLIRGAEFITVSPVSATSSKSKNWKSKTT